MSALLVVALALTVAAPVLVTSTLSLRRESGQRRLLMVLGTAAVGALAAAGSLLLQRILAQQAGVTSPLLGRVDLVGGVYFFLVLCPLDQSLTALSSLPAIRSRFWRSPYDTMRISTAAAAGFATVPLGYLAMHSAPSWLLFARLAASAWGHAVFTSLWGYALGRSMRRKLGGRWFTRMFLVATAFTGLCDYLVFTRGPGALVAAIPLIASASVVSLLARRDLRKMSKLPTRGRSRLLRVEPPSLEQIRDALSRKRRPLMLKWVVFGTFVTMGVLTTSIAVGVYVGRRAGVDFAAVDRGSAEGAISALVLLGTLALGAFPLSGFLLAKASQAKGVLEPALGAALAITTIVVLLGLAAPVAVVFALAFAPVAFALACAGAWIGLES